MGSVALQRSLVWFLMLWLSSSTTTLKAQRLSSSFTLDT
jgi:hypothetical protein